MVVNGSGATPGCESTQPAGRACLLQKKRGKEHAMYIELMQLLLQEKLRSILMDSAGAPSILDDEKAAMPEGLPGMMGDQQYMDLESVLGAVEPHLISAFCLVASWSMAIGSYSKLLKKLLAQHNGYLCKVRKTTDFALSF